jgi:hypothetical protein
MKSRMIRRIAKEHHKANLVLTLANDHASVWANDFCLPSCSVEVCGTTCNLAFCPSNFTLSKAKSTPCSQLFAAFFAPYPRVSVGRFLALRPMKGYEHLQA